MVETKWHGWTKPSIGRRSEISACLDCWTREPSVTQQLSDPSLREPRSCVVTVSPSDGLVSGQAMLDYRPSQVETFEKVFRVYEAAFAFAFAALSKELESSQCE